ncbi:MAG TPA: methyltransferase regulatory domain-containing protein [Pseudoduganella sp.]
MEKQWWEPGPEHLNFACALAGMEPVPLDRAFNYLALDCGRESGELPAKGRHPNGSFHAASAGSQAVAGLPPMDFIVLRGAYSWLEPKGRQQVVELLDRCLKPGGVAYVGYNALPGCSGLLPLQRLVREQGRLHGGGTAQQLEHAAAQVGQLRAAGAAYFLENDTPAMRGRLQGMLQTCREFTQHGWQALYHADVARAMADAKLEYVASAELWLSDPARCLTAPQRALLEAQTIPVLRETVRDVLLDTAFRHDVYVRGTRRMHPMRQADWLGGCRLALASTRETVRGQALSGPFLAALAAGPQSIEQLARLPAMQGKGVLDAAREAGALVDSGQAVFCSEGA